MTVHDIVALLGARVLCCEDLLDEEVRSACGSDLMSDVLAFVKERSVLLTGLTNQHAIRTAEILDVLCVIFVRGKEPTDDILAMAKERDIVILVTEYTLFTACGILYEQGLRGGRPHHGR